MSKVLKQILGEERVELETPPQLHVVPNAVEAEDRSSSRGETFDRPIRELLRERRASFERTEEEKAERRREKLEATLHKHRRPSLVPILLVLIAASLVLAYRTRTGTPLGGLPGVDAPAAAAPVPTDPALIAGNREAIELYRKGDLRAAMRKIDSLIKRYPGKAELHVNSALIRSRIGQRVSARKDLEAALRIEPKNATALNNLAMLDLEARLYAPAIHNLEAAVKAEPEYATARLNYARALELAGRREEAVVQYREAATRFPSDPTFTALLRKRVQKLEEGR